MQETALRKTVPVDSRWRNLYECVVIPGVGRPRHRDPKEQRCALANKAERSMRAGLGLCTNVHVYHNNKKIIKT